MKYIKTFIRNLNNTNKFEEIFGMSEFNKHI